MTIASPTSSESQRYAKTLETAKRTRWDIDRDVIRGRSFDFSHKFLPDGLSLADELPFLSADARRFMSQVQGRTYANMFALVERFIGVKMLELSRHHGLGDQTALEAIVGFTGEELKHQELFRRIEVLVAEQMPAGYVFVPEPNEVAGFVLGKCNWAVLALICDIEFFSLAHYRASIDAADGISALFKDVFLHHWKEESQHVVIDEMEWEREDRALASDAQRDAAVDDLIALVGGVDGIVQAQAQADASYFLRVSGMSLDDAQARQVSDTLLKAYRWQYIVSGAMEPRFQAVLGRLVNGEQLARIQAALAPLAYAVPGKMKELVTH